MDKRLRDKIGKIGTRSLKGKWVKSQKQRLIGYSKKIGTIHKKNEKGWELDLNLF